MKQQLRVPNYITQFQCIGGACEDTCCSGFHVPIGQQTYEAYQKVQGKMGEQLQEHVKLHPTSTSPVSYAVINAAGGCPFLTEGRLCVLHAELGEGMLSSACSKYPRSMNMIDHQLERAATLSCPEIARLVLLNREGLAFTEIEGDIDERDLANIVLETNMLPMTQYLYELREYSIDVMQNRSYSIPQRLFVLKKFYYSMKQLVERQEEHLIPQLMKEINLESCEGYAKPVLMEEDMFEVLATLRNIHPFVPRYETVYQQILESRGIETTIGEAFLQEHEYMLENYLVNYMFKQLFPFSYGANVFEAYVMLQLHYDAICFHMRKTADHLGYMNEKEAVRVIQSWVKEAEHNSMYLPTLFKYVRAS